MHKKILIIDDDERNIFALNAVLKARNFNCLSAFSGQDGLQLLKEDPAIDVALVDMMMPGMDGYELIGQIRHEPLLRHLPLIAVTAQAMPGDEEKCLAAGADGYVSKPVDVDKLLQVMGGLLTGNNSRG
ncbi:response regulator [Ferruginibacter sp. HRS2-29]|uniref:response regulator n=1 Tax=Ferruginibacter sp. HRS2-29 TaxID=2487334 RepID=UPI0020CBD982|nr:response regulator [Ferruginibacter sp. HRS2-29]MCP9749727.1 response regulator [Ferruginibacter sp. HRS2-29]